MPNDSAPPPPPPTTLPPVSTVLIASGSPGPKFHLPKSKGWIIVSVIILLVAIPASVLLIKNRNTLFSKANNLVTSVSSGIYTNQAPGNYCSTSTGTCSITDSSKFILRTVCEGKSTTCGRDGEPVSISTTASKSTASVVPEQCGRTVQLDVLADNADCRAGKKGGNSACALNPFAWLVWYSGDCINATVTPVPLPSEEPTPSITPVPLPSEEPTPSITPVPLPSEEPTPSTTPETTPDTTPSPSTTPSATPSTTPTTPSSTPSSTSTPTPTSPGVLTNVPCNSSCSQDSQCESGLVCYLASGSCRKANNITDPTCGNVGSTTSSGQPAPTPTPTPVTQLPRSGATDGTWLVGLGGLLLLGLGALFLI